MGPSQPAVRVEIEAVSLLVHRHRVPVKVEADEVDGDAGGSERNFKQFRKVCANINTCVYT